MSYLVEDTADSITNLNTFDPNNKDYEGDTTNITGSINAYGISNGTISGWSINTFTTGLGAVQQDVVTMKSLKKDIEGLYSILSIIYKDMSEIKRLLDKD